MTIKDIQKNISTPFSLVTSKDVGSIPNIMALSWWTFTSNHPASLFIATGKKSKTCDNIDNTREFTLNLVGNEFIEKGLKCGRYSGHSCNKFELLNIELEDNSLAIKEALFSLNCKVTKIVDLEDHKGFFAEIQSITAGSGNGKILMSTEGYSKLI